MNLKVAKPKSILFELRKVFGLGLRRSKTLCRLLNIATPLKVKSLDRLELNVLALTFSKAAPLDLFRNSLKRKKASILKKMFRLNSLRSSRLKKGLPVRGQRTHTNAQTSRLRLRIN